MYNGGMKKGDLAENKAKGWLLIILLTIFSLRVGNNVYRLYKNGERINETQTELDKAKQKNEQLKKQLAQVQTPEFMERQAKEKLGYGHENEEILVLPEQYQKPETGNNSGNKTEPNWVLWRKLYLGW